MIEASQSNPVALDFASPEAGNSSPPKGLLFGKGDVRLLAGRSRVRPVPDTDTLPQSVDVVVIGGGMLGTMAALTLAERGVSVALCEKGVIAGEASGRAMGFIYSHFADPAKAEMMARAKALWNGLEARIGSQTGYRGGGIIAPIDNDMVRGAAEAWLEAMHDAPEFEGRMLSSLEARNMLPGMVDPPATALYTPTDGSAEPVLAVPAIAEAARAKGARILQNCAVRALETSAGKISGVVTEKGTIACQSVIVAAGAWTPRFTRSIGAKYAQADVFMSMAIVKASNDFATNVSGSSYGMRQRRDGSYSFGAMKFAVPVTPSTLANFRQLMPTMKAFKEMADPGIDVGGFWRQLWEPKRLRADRPGSFEAFRVLAPAYNDAPVAAGLEMMKTRFPGFADAQITERWAGIISTTLDNMPLISAVPQQAGLYIGSGFSNGFTFGTAAGEALADLATGNTPKFDLGAYRLGRFSDGSQLRYHA